MSHVNTGHPIGCLDYKLADKGWQQLHQADIARAIQTFREALTMNALNTHALNGLGAALCKQFQPDKALPFFQEALAQQHPEPHLIHCNLGNTYATLGQYERALMEYEKAFQLSPHSWRVHSLLGLTCAKLNRFDQALFHYKIALRLQPAIGDNYYNLGVAYYRINNPAASKKYLEQYIQRFPNGKMLDSAKELLIL